MVMVASIQILLDQQVLDMSYFVIIIITAIYYITQKKYVVVRCRRARGL